MIVIDVKLLNKVSAEAKVSPMLRMNYNFHQSLEEKCHTNGSWLRVPGSWLIVTIIGCGISVTIGSLQFFLMRGFSEVDDVMHNTLGCLIGYVMSVTFVYGKIKIQNHRT